MADLRVPPHSACSFSILLLVVLLLTAPVFAQTTPVWQFAGPQPLSSGITTYGDVAGRIAAIAADPLQPSVVFAGGMGGVWKTTDDGLSWQPLTTAYAAASVGALAFDPRQPGVVYAGTGDPNGAQGSYAGTGLLVSSDEGQHWSTLGAVYFAGLAISRIAIDPGNSKHLLVAAVTAQDSPSGTQPGLYESTDGGQTWSVPNGLSTGEAWDFAWDLAHGVVIAAIGSHLYRSADNGSSFTVLSGTTIPSVITRAALCSLPGTQDFLLVTADAQFNLGALLQSSDGGQTWTSLTAPPGLFGSSGAGQGFYDIAIAADSTTPGHWWLGGVDAWETKDGGNTWTDLATVSPIHPNQHALLFAGGLLWIGNDGGVWNEDSAGKLHNLNSGLTNLGLQSLTTSSALPGLWATSLENGIVGRSSSTASWNVVQIGGGGMLAIAPKATQPLVFVAPQLTGIETSTDGGQTFTNPIPATAAASNTPLADSGNAPWLVPVTVDPNHSGTIYVGSWRVWKSVDAGASWTELAGSESTGFITAISVSPANSNAVYAATSTGSILVSTDAGTSWTTAAASGLPARPLTDLRAAADSAQHLWAAFGGRNAIAPSGHVFVSSDGGATWASRSNGLPDAPVQRMLLDPVDPNAAYAALSGGVYATADGGASWQPLGTGLPLVPVNDLQFDSNHDLLAATLGRGVWVLAAGQRVTAISGGGQSATVRATLQPLTVRVTSSTGTPIAGVIVQWSDSGAGGILSASSSTTDSQGMASLTYTLPAKSGSVTVDAMIQYSNGNGSTSLSTASFSETANPGAPASLDYVGGSNQSAAGGTRLPQALSVRVADGLGNGVPNVPVSFSDNNAGGTFASATVSTDTTGLAADDYTLPSTPGAITATASSAGLPSVSFPLTATPPPDFQWQPVSGSLSVQQNGVLTISLKTTAIGGDTAPISLLCLQPATGCSFNLNPVAPGAAVTLSLSAGALTAGATNTVVVQGGDGVQTHQLQFGVTVVMPPGLLLSSDPGQMNLAAGGQGVFTLTLTPQGGLSGPVQLNITGANGAALPTGMTVTFAPSAPTLTGAALSDALTVLTTSRVLASKSWPPIPSLPWRWGGVLLGLLMMLVIVRARRPLPALALALFLVTASACGGGGAAPAYRAPASTVNPNGTPAGAYSLTVTATSGSVSASTKVTVTVN